MTTATKARACEGKHAHASRPEADAHRLGLLRLGAARSAIVTYRCRHCRLWHVGHRARRRR